MLNVQSARTLHYAVDKYINISGECLYRDGAPCVSKLIDVLWLSLSYIHGIYICVCKIHTYINNNPV